jgi:hypothetical protein
MNDGIWVKEALAVGIILLFIGTYSIPAVAHPQDDNKPQGIFFNLQFTYIITWEANATQEPIMPGETREVNMTISYTVTRGALGRLLLQLLEGKSFPIQLSIEDKPDWCEAWMLPEDMTGVIPSDEIGVQYSSLFIHVSDDAPSNYTNGYVKMCGTIESMKGPFNILTLIQGYENDFTILFVAGTGP